MCFFSNWPFPFCLLPVTLLFRLLVMLFNRSPQTSQASSACRGWIFPSRQHQSHLCTNIGFFEIGARKRLQAAPPILTSLLEGEIRLADPRGDRLQRLSHRADYRNHIRSGCWMSVFCFKQVILWNRLRFSSRLRWVCGQGVLSRMVGLLCGIPIHADVRHDRAPFQHWLHFAKRNVPGDRVNIFMPI